MATLHSFQLSTIHIFVTQLSYFSFDFDRNCDRSLGLISDSYTFNVVVPLIFPIIITALDKLMRIVPPDMNVKCLLLITRIELKSTMYV